MKKKTTIILITSALFLAVVLVQFSIISIFYYPNHIQDTLPVPAFLIVSLAVALSFATLAAYVIKTMCEPLSSLEKTLNEVSRGNINVQLDKKLMESGDELGSLARAFNRMLVSLKIAIKTAAPELKKEAAEKELIQKEKIERFKESFYDENG